MKRLAVLGSTGSVGTATLDLVARFPDRFAAVALAAGRNVGRLRDQIERHRPDIVAVADEQVARELGCELPGYRGELLWGEAGLRAVATWDKADLVVSALVGALGLGPTLAAIDAGKDVALANKEVLVVAGEAVTAAARRRGISLLPLDSEHGAIFQALRGHDPRDVRRLILTASGGPFLRRPLAELGAVTPEQALRHPTWKMGSKITIDSATLMNKGFEVIEARWLFGVQPEQVEVVIHPQSVVHSMVEYIDGSVIAQLAVADMAVPIAYALAYPGRLPLGHLPSLDFAGLRELTFEAPEPERFPCLGLAYRALARGGTAPAVLNAANEVAVERFLAGQIPFTAIAGLVEQVLEEHEPMPNPGLETLLAADRWARERAAILQAFQTKAIRPGRSR